MIYNNTFPKDFQVKKQHQKHVLKKDCGLENKNTRPFAYRNQSITVLTYK